jgi:phosphomannomutase
VQPLIISYSGIRGIVGESLNEEVAFRFGRAFGRIIGADRPGVARVLVARDTRPSGPDLVRGVERGLGQVAELVDLGIVPTPTLQFAMRPLAAVGAVCVTASHNPSAWNGMKFFLGPDNLVLDGDETRRLCALAAADGSPEPSPPSPARDGHGEAVRLHVEQVCAQVDVGRIRSRGFRVALDSARGAGAEATTALLQALRCEVRLVDAERESEPLPQHLHQLCGTVVEAGCAVGFAQDLDADRLALVTEQGDAPGEERTLVLVIDHLLERHPRGRRTVVKNIATTRAVDDVVRSHGASLRETRVGEINLSRALLQELRAGNIAFGGEGNGGVILPAVSLGRDSLAGIALVLECLAQGARPLSERLAALPSYHMSKGRLPVDRQEPLDLLLQRIAGLYPEGITTYPDGLKVDFPDGSWLVVRPSNTESILRVVAESSSSSWTAEVVERIERLAGRGA